MSTVSHWPRSWRRPPELPTSEAHTAALEARAWQDRMLCGVLAHAVPPGLRCLALDSGRGYAPCLGEVGTALRGRLGGPWFSQRSQLCQRSLPPQAGRSINTKGATKTTSIILPGSCWIPESYTPRTELKHLISKHFLPERAERTTPGGKPVKTNCYAKHDPL